MVKARKDQEGSGVGGLYVGCRTHVAKASTYASIVNTATDNRIQCVRCYGTKFEIKGGDSVDCEELPTTMDGYAAAGELNMVVIRCVQCGLEQAKNLAVNGEWTEQV